MFTNFMQPVGSRNAYEFVDAVSGSKITQDHSPS